MRIRIGDLLVKAGVITELQLKAALAEQSQWGGKLGDILVRMEFLTEEVLVRALSKQSGIPRADLSGEPNKAALVRLSGDTAEEFNVVPIGVKDEGRILVVAMSDPGNVMVTDHVRQIAGSKIEPHIAGATAIRNAIARWYRGAELGEESTGMKIMNNAGITQVTVDPRKKRGETAPATRPKAISTPPPVAQPPRNGGAVRPSAVEVLRGVEETQRRSVAALKAMVELLIEKGVFSRDEYLARVKR
jgi:hypothetical protein